MQILQRIILIYAVLQSFACEDEKSPEFGREESFGFLFNAVGFAETHSGDTFFWQLRERETNVVVEQGDLEISEDTFEIRLDNAVESGKRYYFLSFADLNQNGSCDTPPEDHSWRYNIDTVTKDVEINEIHNMAFADICESYKSSGQGPSDVGQTVTISGALELADGVTLDSVGSGESIAGAQIFAAGFPEQEAFTAADGTFQLELNLPESSTLAPENIKLLMWFTEKDPDSKFYNSVASKRVGALRNIEDGGAPVNVDTVPLNFTKGIRIRIEDSSDQSAVDHCWLSVEGLEFQTAVQYDKDNERYEIEYLPPSSYNLKCRCMGYEEKEVPFTIDEATDFNQWFGPVTVQVNKS